MEERKEKKWREKEGEERLVQKGRGKKRLGMELFVLFG